MRIERLDVGCWILDSRHWMMGLTANEKKKRNKAAQVKK